MSFACRYAFRRLGYIDFEISTADGLFDCSRGGFSRGISRDSERSHDSVKNWNPAPV